jgi:hypothetical protein
MTDHFKDCRNGDIITVVLRGEFERCGQQDCFIKKDGNVVCMAFNEPSLVSIKIEPRPWSTTDRFVFKEPQDDGSYSGAYYIGQILFIDGEQAYVKYDHTNERGNVFLNEIVQTCQP